MAFTVFKTMSGNSKPSGTGAYLELYAKWQPQIPKSQVLGRLNRAMRSFLMGDYLIEIFDEGRKIICYDLNDPNTNPRLLDVSLIFKNVVQPQKFVQQEPETLIFEALMFELGRSKQVESSTNVNIETTKLTGGRGQIRGDKTMNRSEKSAEWLEKHPHIDGQAFDVIAESVKNILRAIGEDPNREGLVDTPHRVAKMYLGEIFSGYAADPLEIAKQASFKEKSFGNLVLVDNIKFYSMCEHHMLPFFGKVHIAYLPGDRVLGLSKLARVVDACSKKLQLQENLGQEVANAIQAAANSQAVVVIVESDAHLCMNMRGVKNDTAGTKTIAISTGEGWTANMQELTSTVLGLLK